MIALDSDCLIFQMANGENIPCSADMVAVELAGDTGALFDPDFVQEATKAVFHYFKHELAGKPCPRANSPAPWKKCCVASRSRRKSCPTRPRAGVLECDLCRLALECGPGRELFFFPRLRAELQRHLRQAPRGLRFRGLRRCVKQLAGARRWSPRCQTLEGEIVSYLRGCLSAETGPVDLALLVE